MLQVAMDQVAFCARTDADEAQIKETLQLENDTWIEDLVTASGTVGAEAGTNVAKLLFNYGLDHEVEILRYISGPNYLDLAEIPGGHLCHIGMHALNGVPLPRIDAPVIQQVHTLTHTNPFLVENNKHYRYTIYDTKGRLGVFLKIIERL